MEVINMNIIQLVNSLKGMEKGKEIVKISRGCWYKITGQGEGRIPTFNTITPKKMVMDENSP